MSTSSRFAVAVHILTLLAQAEGPVPSSMIAGSVGTNPALIRRMIGTLTEAGFVTTSMGSTGGATLARPASDITLLDVFRATETTALITLHQSAPNPACMVGREITGALQAVADRAQAAMDASLAEITIASMLGEVEHAARRRKR
ncbi:MULTISPECIES: Rrf2 family transcriptional regulator [unclassified Cupriavidus]|uniref:Rrf2 family transcriptional regulator n=1 Tax=unclassified Cupriavidus TaxID=2640874 RepID=UPI001C001922|nr:MULTISPECIES: Rrf2 family transcriptional regulator [unclassified Cupriavidus]MCA3186614.1 Rrf2 family transcriptional regulator [Cupriavidus sp.]MCA3191578.1 Rrf2 family transcriptional regulator [Cupriavidus sp.]MCA3199827.1 Rrf2 family transcriptional regulator [Cupriavidus sp.]MCA3201661.1 Rrf2 family transcriptional regulator [Cupriavidus sp.]MCA3209942.1 Rrf2 family transcriptional regulator [Cupriavidus sp.]